MHLTGVRVRWIAIPGAAVMLAAISHYAIERPAQSVGRMLLARMAFSHHQPGERGMTPAILATRPSRVGSARIRGGRPKTVSLARRQRFVHTVPAVGEALQLGRNRGNIGYPLMEKPCHERIAFHGVMAGSRFKLRNIRLGDE